jgi:hypothetical protein
VRRAVSLARVGQFGQDACPSQDLERGDGWRRAVATGHGSGMGAGPGPVRALQKLDPYSARDLAPGVGGVSPPRPPWRCRGVPLYGPRLCTLTPLGEENWRALGRGPLCRWAEGLPNPRDAQE